MKKIIIRIGVALVACLIVFACVHLYWRLTDPLGYRNMTLCNQLPQDITVTQLMATLGEPIYRREIDHEVWLFFKTLSIAAGPIKAQISESDGKVLKLRCSYDGPDTWRVTDYRNSDR